MTLEPWSSCITLQCNVLIGGCVCFFGLWGHLKVASSLLCVYFLNQFILAFNMFLCVHMVIIGFVHPVK